jgi:hypothetical protein
MSPRVCLRGLIDRSAHLHLRSGARDPPDLDAIFRRVPVLATRFLSRVPLLGMSKDRPSIVQAAEYVSRAASDSRCRSSCSVLRDGNADSHPRAVLVVSHHLDGFSSMTLRPYFRPLPILGFIAFRSVCETGSPRCTYRPSKLSLRRQLRKLRRRISVSARARVTGSIWTLACRPSLRSPRTLPPRPCLLRRR